MPEPLHQAELRRPTARGEMVTMRWVPAATRDGDRVSIGGREWTARLVYRGRTVEAPELRRDWKVGGLGA